MNARRRVWVAAAIGWALPLLFAPTARAEPPPPATSALSLEAIRIEPEASAADTLHQLRVRVRNDGEQPASHLVFRVRVGTHDLVVYSNLVYLQALPPHASTEVQLHHFWSSETGRPFPADGKLTVEVTLAEAQWVRIDTKDGVESTTPLAPVVGLPVSRTVTQTGPKE